MNGRSERREASRAGTSLRGKLERTGERIAAAARAAAPTLPRGAVLSCVAFMLCRATLLGARPFGFAWLAAAPHGVPFIAAGILISALTLGGRAGGLVASVWLLPGGPRGAGGGPGGVFFTVGAAAGGGRG